MNAGARHANEEYNSIKDGTESGTGSKLLKEVDSDIYQSLGTGM